MHTNNIWRKRKLFNKLLSGEMKFFSVVVKKIPGIGFDDITAGFIKFIL